MVRWFQILSLCFHPRWSHQTYGFDVVFTLTLFSNFISYPDLFPELHSDISICLFYIFTWLYNKRLRLDLLFIIIYWAPPVSQALKKTKRFLLSWSPHYSFGDTQMNSGKGSAEKEKWCESDQVTKVSEGLTLQLRSEWWLRAIYPKIRCRSIPGIGNS